MHLEKHLKGPNSAKFQFWICTRTSIFFYFLRVTKDGFWEGMPGGNCFYLVSIAIKALLTILKRRRVSTGSMLIIFPISAKSELGSSIASCKR